MSYRNAALQMGTKTRQEILQAYGINAGYGHECARRYVFEVAEAVALEEDRSRAASMLYEIADAVVGKIPLPESLFPPVEAKPKPPEPAPAPPKPTPWQAIRRMGTVGWVLGFIAGFFVGGSL